MLPQLKRYSRSMKRTSVRKTEKMGCSPPRQILGRHYRRCERSNGSSWPVQRVGGLVPAQAEAAARRVDPDGDASFRLTCCKEQSGRRSYPRQRQRALGLMRVKVSPPSLEKDAPEIVRGTSSGAA